MKKLFALITFVGVLLIGTHMEAQTFQRLKQGAAADTIHKSTTLYTAAVNLNYNTIQAVTIEVATDSVSGTPDTKYVLQRSVDGTHWTSVAGDTLAPVYIGNGNTTHPSVSKTLSISPFYGAWARVKVYTGSGTQKSKMWIALKASTAGVK